MKSSHFGGSNRVIDYVRFWLQIIVSVLTPGGGHGGLQPIREQEGFWFFFLQ